MTATTIDADDRAADAFAAWVATSGEADAQGRCRRCSATGRFITYVENGVPKGPGGPCYRCGGKGYQTEADTRRNWGWDNYGQRVG